MKYVWFSPEATAEIKRRLNEAPEGSVLKFSPHKFWGKEPGWTVEVAHPESGTAKVLDDDPVNDSRVCPPACWP